MKYTLLAQSSRRVEPYELLKRASDFLLDVLTELPFEEDWSISEFNLGKGTLNFILQLTGRNPSYYFQEPGSLINNLDGFSDYTKVTIIKTEIDEEIKKINEENI